MLTVKQLYKVLADSCDLIAMQKHTGDLTFGDDFSIATLPIECFVDCFVHQGFNLAHDQKSDGVCVWGSFPPPVETTLGHLGDLVKGF